MHTLSPDPLTSESGFGEEENTDVVGPYTFKFYSHFPSIENYVLRSYVWHSKTGMFLHVWVFAADC